MKASGITAIGLVAAAGLWIASGHLLPARQRRGPRGDPGPRSGQEGVPRRRRRDPAGAAQPQARRFPAAPRPSATAPSPRAPAASSPSSRSSAARKVKEGEVLAVLSDDARAAQVAQGKSLVFQRRTELESKRKLIETGALPRLDLVNMEAALKTAEAALAAPRPSATAASSLAPWTGVINDVMVEVGDAAFSFQGRELAKIVCARSDAGGGRGGRAQARRPQGRRGCEGAARHRRGRRRAHPPRREDREPVDKDLPGRGRAAECRRRDPRRHHRGGVGPARQGGGGAGAALGADHLLERRHRRAHRQRGRPGRLLGRSSIVEDEQSQMWVGRRSPTAPG